MVGVIISKGPFCARVTSSLRKCSFQKCVRSSELIHLDSVGAYFFPDGQDQSSLTRGQLAPFWISLV